MSPMKSKASNRTTRRQRNSDRCVDSVDIPSRVVAKSVFLQSAFRIDAIQAEQRKLDIERKALHTRLATVNARDGELEIARLQLLRSLDVATTRKH
jgi:hypothetical protein